MCYHTSRIRSVSERYRSDSAAIVPNHTSPRTPGIGARLAPVGRIRIAGSGQVGSATYARASRHCHVCASSRMVRPGPAFGRTTFGRQTGGGRTCGRFARERRGTASYLATLPPIDLIYLKSTATRRATPLGCVKLPIVILEVAPAGAKWPETPPARWGSRRATRRNPPAVTRFRIRAVCVDSGAPGGLWPPHAAGSSQDRPSPVPRDPVAADDNTPSRLPTSRPNRSERRHSRRASRCASVRLRRNGDAEARPRVLARREYPPSPSSLHSRAPLRIERQRPRPNRHSMETKVTRTKPV